jgi:protein TonB
MFIHGMLMMKNFESKTKFSYTQKNTDVEKTLLSLILNSKANQIVETIESKDKLKVDKAFLSKNDNTFMRETVARRVEKFNIAGKGSKTGTVTKKVQSAKSKKKSISLSSLRESYIAASQKDKLKKKITIAVMKKGQKTGSAKRQGLHSSNDFIQDMKLGDFTKVNTQEFKYFGFYNRIKYKLEKYWGQNIEAQAQRIMKSGRSIASDKNHLTSLVIQINRLGEILNVKIKSTSGLRELDQAAIKSFNQAGPFPNPPKGMIKNNIATLEWGFVVNT